MQELERLQDRVQKKRNQWHDIQSGKIQFATEAEKRLHLESTWMRWKQAVAELNAHANNRARISSSPVQDEVIRIAFEERTPPHSVSAQI